MWSKATIYNTIDSLTYFTVKIQLRKNDEHDNKIIKTNLSKDIQSNNPLILITDSTVQCTLTWPRPDWLQSVVDCRI